MTGPRQVGKTTLLQRSQGTRRAGYLSFDDPASVHSVRADAKTFLAIHPSPVIFDEIQYVPEIFPYLKMAVDGQRRAGRYYLTGSQQFQLMKNVSESLAGRIGILQLLGLSLREIAGDKFAQPFKPTRDYLTVRNKNARGRSAAELWRIIYTGAFPAVVTGQAARDDFYSAYIKTYIERDVRLLTQVGDELQFMQFITVAASRTAQMVNYRDMARDAGISEPTAKKWLSILVTSGLVYLLPPYAANVAKRVVKTPKLYFLDTGLAAYLTKWNTPETLREGAASGAFFETFVLAEILKSYYNAGLNPALFYYRDKDQKEIDLLIMENGCLYPLEIKKTANPQPQDAAAFKVLSAIKGLPVGSGGVICSCNALGILAKDRYAIPAGFI
ncbi:ATPase [Candidatus Termititenax aidoneus]|uniref:ATPase n=1 Tax=Termititenax aidoneus TaxID=2218524 RepID=A0A388TAH5_TERA1|nr:ATPase [Candidatus Termititenax aidoneus]